MGAVDDSHLVAVLKVASDAVERDARLDPVPCEFLRRPDSREHQELRRVERPGGQDDFAPREHAAQDAGLAAGLRTGPVEVAARAVFDADGAQPLVEQDAGRERLEYDAEAVRLHRASTRSRAPRRRPRDVDRGASVSPSASRPCRRRSFGSSSPSRKRRFRSISRPIARAETS